VFQEEALLLAVEVPYLVIEDKGLVVEALVCLIIEALVCLVIEALVCLVIEALSASLSRHLSASTTASSFLEEAVVY